MMCIPRSCVYNVNVRHVQPPLVAIVEVYWKGLWSSELTVLVSKSCHKVN